MKNSSILQIKSVQKDPFRQFKKWFDEAVKNGVPEPETMVLATASPDGFPSARVVLLKEFSSGGFTFFTNYQSRKGRELEKNRHVALVIYWQKQLRQIRIEGRVKKITRKESEEYFQTRPVGSQLGAWASLQSKIMHDRKILDRRFQEVTVLYKGKTVPLPLHWGGYRVVPSMIEFWQGRASRLHDRIVFHRRRDKGWNIVCLYP
jgi:pyridoxamine 5'-phosphate oxidase